MPPTDREPRVQINNQIPHTSGSGPMIGVVIIVILLIFGALYFWGERLNRQEAEVPPLVKVEGTVY